MDDQFNSDNERIGDANDGKNRKTGPGRKVGWKKKPGMILGRKKKLSKNQTKLTSFAVRKLITRLEKKT